MKKNKVNKKRKKLTMILSGLKKEIKSIKEKSTSSDDLIIFYFRTIDDPIILGQLTLDDSFINDIGDLHAVKEYLNYILDKELIVYW